jgi:hypothetical protein
MALRCNGRLIGWRGADKALLEIPGVGVLSVAVVEARAERHDVGMAVVVELSEDGEVLDWSPSPDGAAPN